MRLQRLDLMAFGHFTNYSIDLSAGRYGLHIIYGPNEAGKSTSLRGLTALLFGFPTRTDDNFKHANKDLRVGAILENRDGKVLRCVRRKARTATLLHAESSQEVSGSHWAEFFPKIQEDHFLRMFGLTHESLRQGGEDLVRGGGDSGQALFSSASGIANLQQKHQSLEDRIEELYGKAGRKGRLYDKLKQYKALRDDEKKVAMSMDQWRRLEKQLQESKDQLEEYRTQSDAVQRQLLEAQRIQRSIPTVAKYLERLRSISTLGAATKLPRDFEERVQKVLGAKAEKQVASEEIANQLRSIESELVKIPESIWDDEQEDKVRSLLSGLGIYLQALEELPKLKIQSEQLARRAEQKWDEIGKLDTLRDKLEKQKIPLSHKKWIGTLAKQYEALEKQVADRKLRLSKLKNRLDEDQNSESLPLSDESLKMLEQRIQQYRPLAGQSDPLAALLMESQRGQDRLEKGIQRWRIPCQTAEELVRFPVASLPSIERWEKELDKRQEALDKARSEQSAQDRKRSAKQREWDREAKKIRVPTRQEWEASKQARDGLFGMLLEHRSGSTERWNELSEAYAASVQSADAMAAELLDQAELVAQREQLQEAILELEAQVAEWALACQERESELTLGQQAWQAFVYEHRIAVETPTEALEWSQAVSSLQREAQDLLDKRIRIEQMQTAIQQAIVVLNESLAACGFAAEPCDGIDRALTRALTRAELVLNKANEARGKAEAIEGQRQLNLQEYRDQTSEIQGLEDQFKELKTQWFDALADIALPDDATPVEVQTILDQVTELQQTTDEIDVTRVRLRESQERVDRYESALRPVLDWLAGASPESADAISAQASTESKVRWLERQSKLSSQEQEKRVTLETLKKTAQEQLDQASGGIRLLDRELEQMQEIAGAQDQEQLRELARNSREYHLLDLDRKDLQERLFAECNSRDIDPFVQRVEQADADQISIDIKHLSEEIRRIDHAREEAIRATSALQRDYDQLDTSGRAAMLATQASGVGLEIEEAVQELATLRLASVALTAGIERYRSANEDPILKLASESFRQMTLGRFRGIEISLDDAGKHLLVGRRAEDGPGSEALVEQMSDGTRDQLYLALRLASLEQWSKVHEPLPLVVDDILVHFDDQRSVETLKQLVRISSQSQVIFFTHHQHLLDLARETLPTDQVFFHELANASG